MQHNRNLMLGIASLAVFTTPTTLHAGTPTPVAAPPPDNPGDWCDWLSGKPGKVEFDNPVLQELHFFGRFQWQAAYITGSDTNGYGYADNHTEVRRFRLGMSAKFLNYFKVKANVNLVDDRTNLILPAAANNDLGWGYEDFDEAYISFNAAKAFGIDWLDELDIGYGRFKHVLSYEDHQSSKNLLTVERSAISNKVYGSYRPTGVKINAAKGPWSFATALYSTDSPRPALGQVDFIGGWNDGFAYYGAVGFEATDELTFQWDFIYNDADFTRGDDNIWGYKWATSFSADYERDHWGIIANLIYGDNGGPKNAVARRSRQGDFWGVVIMPYYWIVEDKLQAVVRYQYAGAENSQGIRVNSRYMRRDHGPVVNANYAASGAGRGNEHHSIYAGLNYLLCDHNLKLQAGVEYDYLNTPGQGIDGDMTATTFWFAVRSYF
jgi:hypothetical protein